MINEGELYGWLRSIFKFLVRTAAWCMHEKYGDKNLNTFIEPHINNLYYRKRKRDKGMFEAYYVLDQYNFYKDLDQVKCYNIPILSNRTQDVFDFSKKSEAEKLITRENFLV